MVPKIFGRQAGVGTWTALQGKKEEEEREAAAVQGSAISGAEGPASIRSTTKRKRTNDKKSLSIHWDLNPGPLTLVGGL